MMFQPFGQYSDGILALLVLAASWLLLRVEGRRLDVLGFNQPARRLKEFAIAFALMGAAVVLIHLIPAMSLGTPWQWNRYFIVGDFFKFLAIPILFKALVVALLFQGYLLWQLLRFAGPNLGLYSAAVIFGLYDVFALHAEGNILRAAAVFLTSGIYGFVLALAFRQTGSLAAPMGMNLAWHFFGKAVFAGIMPAFEMFHLPEGENLDDAGWFAGVMSFAVLAGTLATYSWWLVSKDPDKGNADRGIETVRTQG